MFSYSLLIPQRFQKTWNTIIKLARIQINTSSPHSLSPDLFSQRWKTPPLRLFHTRGLCARAKSPAVSGTAMGRPAEGEHFETDVQQPHSGGNHWKTASKQLWLCWPSGVLWGWGLAIIGGEWKGAGKGNRKKKEGNADYLENNRTEMWIFTTTVNKIRNIYMISYNRRFLSFAYSQLPKVLNYAEA